VRLAREAALGVRGVAGLSAGPGRLVVAADRGETLTGVAAEARSDGRFDVRVAVVVSEPLPPLQDLAERIRARLEETAAAQGLRELLGPVEVSVADVASPDGLAAGRTAP
jgi:hypothetical protein